MKRKRRATTYRVDVACLGCGAARSGYVSDWCRSCAARGAERKALAGTTRPALADAHRAKIAAHARDRYTDLHGNPYWTPERIIAALRAHNARVGHAPTSAEWRRARHARAENRFGDRRSRPSSTTVERVFGSWSAGLRAAGLEPRKRRVRPRKKCANGHPQIEGNVYVRSDGGRQCAVCVRERRQRRQFKDTAS